MGKKQIIRYEIKKKEMELKKINKKDGINQRVQGKEMTEC